MTLGTLLLYTTMRTLSGFACLLPRSLALRLGSLLACLAWLIYRCTPVRDFIPTNVSAAYPRWPQQRLRQVAAQSLDLLIRAIVEVMRFPRWHQEATKIVILEGREHLDQALARGKGAIVVTAHFGNWELLAAALVRWFAPLTVLVQTPSKSAFARLFVEYRQLVGVKTYANLGPASIRTALRALRRGELLGLLCDQHGWSGAGMAIFFGHHVSVPLGPFILAQRTGAQIIPARIIREKHDRHVLVISPPLTIAPEPSANAQTLMTHFESWIREHPDHWLWIHNRWEKAKKTARPATSQSAGKMSAIALITGIQLMSSASMALAAERPVILAFADRLEVLDVYSPKTHGTIPLPGQVEATLFLPAKQLLAVHVPAAATLALIDLKPFSPTRYRTVKTFTATELGTYDLSFKEAGDTILLGYARRVVAALNKTTWQLTLGFDRPDAIPYPFSGDETLYFPGKIFVLKAGQLSFENTRRDPQD
ncbi:MAG: lysophospholipid acyltransferase family protein, partial [Cyanobacteria bacterium NC_groundwater_1444_Ag_S-0.65um_54_12]|nr:lysophospholipid acyltransferase family protein [Cyanobacteria bacterium NC_groundwater_1444_Ag_S-0.65um_54_12]